MVTIQNLLQVKGSTVWSIDPQTPTLEALRLMTQKGVGALLVMENGKVAGIISERDFVHRIAAQGSCDLNEPVESYMTREVITVRPDQPIEDCMELMTNRRIRHLPVMQDGELSGLISIGDVVKALISDHQWMIQMLESYIEGRGRV